MAWNNTSKTPNYCLAVDVVIRYDMHDEKTLKAGSFVSPVGIQYVPKHVLDNPHWRGFNKLEDIFVHTNIGFIAVKKTSVRER